MLSEKAKEYLSEFRQRYNAEEIIAQIRSLRSMKVLVIGDTIIDQYEYCSSIGKSPKDNVMVVKYIGQETFAGGVLAAANHIAGFTDKVDLVTCLGQQETHESFIRRHLKQNIIPKFFYREDTVTPVKRRFVEPVKLTKIFGVSVLDDYALPAELSSQVCRHLQPQNYDMILVTDFGHGFISRDIIEVLRKAKFLAVNTQTNTDNVGFNLITKYPMADYICLDEPETRLACQNKYGNLSELVEEIHYKMVCDKIAITHGQYDTLVYEFGDCYQIPVFSNGVKDTTGAGDAFLSITSLCVAGGLGMELVGFIGNAVGALKVGTVCNRTPIEPEPLFSLITDLLK